MKGRITVIGVGLLLAGALVANAHTTLCDCFDNGDGTITCVGGFSDGSSASGLPVRVKATSGKLLIEGVMTEDSEYTFDKPEGDYTVVFDAGKGHQVEVPGKEIVE